MSGAHLDELTADLPYGNRGEGLIMHQNDPSARPQTVIYFEGICLGSLCEASGRHLLGGIWDLGASGRHLRDLGGIWEASERDLGGIWEASGRDLGGTWDASGRDLGGIWEASGAPGGPRGPRRHLGGDCVHFPVFYQQKWRDRVSRVDETSLSFTLMGNLQQLSAGADPAHPANTPLATKKIRQNPYR